MDRILSEIWRVLALGARLIMIEQASLSNQTSGTVTRVSTEAHYITALSKKFSVKTFQRVRSSKFSGLSIKCLRLANYLPWFFPIVLNYLAKTEIRRAQNASETYFSSITYYDFIAEAVVHK